MRRGIRFYEINIISYITKGEGLVLLFTPVWIFFEFCTDLYVRTSRIDLGLSVQSVVNNIPRFFNC